MPEHINLSHTNYELLIFSQKCANARKKSQNAVVMQVLGILVCAKSARNLRRNCAKFYKVTAILVVIDDNHLTSLNNDKIEMHRNI